MTKVFLTEAINPRGIELLRTKAEVILGTDTNPDTIIKEAQECEAILIRSAKISREIIEKLPKLRIIAKHGIGTDNIDLGAATEKGVMVVNAPEANINSVAEHALAMIMTVSKNMLFLDKKVRKGEFGARNKYLCTEVKGKTVGLIGYGRISRILAGKLKALDVKILAYDAFAGEDVKKAAAENGTVMVDSAEEIYQQSDFVSIHIPLTEETRNMISGKELSMMKPNAFLINVARGGIVDEEALYDALKDRKIAGAALDVFEKEPPGVENPLFELENLVVSPHNAALTHEAMIAMAVDSSQGIVDFFLEQQPGNIVNREILQKI
ncbi:MAG: hydroxyacid dehydrogenase [Tindallia sp. MSAO_Bac2]|nr:MAG: hydroxyacid dehydrogenase [Tindallia sp. MSAO_Bac2]